jgi:hypothetical protein
MKDPNPVRYLHSTLDDGFFQKGPGVHKPTYAARVELNKAQFDEIYNTIRPHVYNYKSYSLTQNQCTTFVAQVASIAGVDLKYEVLVNVPQYALIGDTRICLWQDKRYEWITVSSPDILERGLVEAVLEGKAQPAMRWYKSVFPLIKEE